MKKCYCIILFVITSIILVSCSNKKVTNLSNDFRQIDLLNKNKVVVKTYYQSFNNQIYDWINVSCNVLKKTLKEIYDCRLTEVSKTILKRNKEGNPQQISNADTANSNNSIEQNNNQKKQSSVPNFPAEENFSTPPEQILNNQFENCNDPEKC
ncbi:hypothetical protein N9U23_03740 [Candidatus Pelagibacter sp.]|nr:hypothetical protein [Candidatus Pelagibacter sp.]